METRRILMRSLAVAVVIASVIWTTTAEKQQQYKSCCTKVSTAEVTIPILNIRLQRQSLPCVKAVIFETEWGDVCSDPRQPWVKEKVQFFRAQRNKPLTTTAPPTSSISDQTHVGRATQDKASPAEEQKVKESCCTQVSRAKLTDPILNITFQRESLPCVWAVIFETERGYFCSDPRQP